MTTFDRIVIIFNPKSTGDAPQLAKDLVAELKSIGKQPPIKLIETKHAGHALEIAQKAATKGRPLLVSVSGDGGYNEVVNGVMAASNPQATVSVLPAGNGNDHARVMHDEPLIDLIRKNSVIKMDVLRMVVATESGGRQSRYAHSYIGFGLTPTVAVELEKGGKGSIHEVITTWRTFHKFKPFKIEYSDGKRAAIDSLIFANISEMAKVAKLSQSGSPDDGVFELIEIPHVSKVRAAYYAAKAVITGLGEQPSLRSFEFKILQAMPAQLDGQPWELKEPALVTIKCHKAALRTLA